MENPRPTTWWWKLSTAVAMLAVAPMVAWYTLNCWEKSSTRVVCIAIPVLILWGLWRGGPWKASGPTAILVRQRFALICFALGLILLIAGSWWMSQPAFFWGGSLVFLAWGLGSSDRVAWPSLTAIAGAMALLSPWPADGLNRISESLRLFGAWSLSGLLDGLGFGNFRSGMVLQVAEQVHLVRDLLKGIDGLLPLIVLAILILFLGRRSFFHAILLLASVPFWLVTGYVLYGFIAVLVQQVAGIEWDSSGWRVISAAGIASFQALSLIASDWLLAQLTRPVPERLLSTDLIITSKGLNQILCWPKSTELEHDKEDFQSEQAFEDEHVMDPSEQDHSGPDESEPIPSESEQVELTNSDTWDESDLYWKPSDWRWSQSNLVWMLVAFVALALALPFTWLEAHPLAVPTLSQVSSDILARLPDQTSMPTDILGLKLTSYEDSNAKDQQPSDPQGNDESKSGDGDQGDSDAEKKPTSSDQLLRAWKYEDAERSAIVFIELPLNRIDAWKFDPTLFGWRTRPRSANRKQDEDLADEEEKDFRHIELVGELDGNAHVWWSGSRLDGQPLEDVQKVGWWKNVVARFHRNLWFAWQESQQPASLCVQHRVIFESAARLTQSEVEEAEKWFVEVRQQLVKLLQAKTE